MAHRVKAPFDGRALRMSTGLYEEYRAFREELFDVLREANPRYAAQRRLGRLVALTQGLLDRWIFIHVLEVAGIGPDIVAMPLRARLLELAASPSYDPQGGEGGAALKTAWVSASALQSFAQDPELDALRIPNWILCGRGSGGLLGLWAKHGFGEGPGAGEVPSLTALSRVFEQGIGDLELMAARVEGRAIVDIVGKRKRDGAYYTPEWVTKYIVEQTVGARLAELRRELGLHRLAESSPLEYAQALRAYGRRLDAFKVVDPACGAGALLIQAFDLLYEQRRWLALELEGVSGAAGLFDGDAAARAVLETNLHGVDLNPESVEFTRLALRLRAAALTRALPSAGDNIRRGNALDGRDFDWARAFPAVFGRVDAGFDCVIGNPPYVKLQHFRRTREEVANYLIHARGPDNAPLYASTQTGNFDLYLPFIEKGVSLLNPAGKLGYLAPSLWLVSEYGEGLRSFVRRTRSLERWLDFESYQVFADATTYTALQLFSGRPRAGIRCAFAPRGPDDLAVLDWGTRASTIAYSRLPEAGAWQLMPPAKLELWDKLRSGCAPLERSCEQIFVGVQTSADHIYHLRKIGPGKYRCGPKRAQLEVEIEDALMRPLISGAEANRYEEPRTDTYLLFPYTCSGERASLIPAEVMHERFPLAWAYLRGHERALRGRERGKMDRDDRWWGYNYPKNLSKQPLAKLLVAQTVPSLRVAYDVRGRHYLNNVRVNGVIAASVEDAWFLLAVLNAPVADYVFRATAKRKAGGYFEANKQFIAPLPIPAASAEQKTVVGNQAKRLQELHTRRARIVREQVALDDPRGQLDAAIEAAEGELNALIYGLYGLSEAEIRLIEAG